MGTVRARGLRPDAQPVGHGAHTRRLVGRVCGGRRCTARRCRPRQRHLRVDPHSVGALRPGRSEAVTRPDDRQHRRRRPHRHEHRRCRHPLGTRHGRAPRCDLGRRLVAAAPGGRREPCPPLRVGLCTQAFSGSAVDPENALAAEHCASLLEGLGCSVEISSPSPLSDPALWKAAATCCSQSTSPSRSTPGRPSSGGSSARDDLEPTTWRLVGAGRAVDGVELLAAQSLLIEHTAHRRGVVGALRSARHAHHSRRPDAARRLHQGLRVGPRQRVHPSVQRHRAAGDQRAARLACRRPAAWRAADRRRSVATIC